MKVKVGGNVKGDISGKDKITKNGPNGIPMSLVWVLIALFIVAGGWLTMPQLLEVLGFK